MVREHGLDQEIEGMEEQKSVIKGNPLYIPTTLSGKLPISGN
jgi:hypothetical protein